MRIVSVRPFLLGEWRVCPSRCGMVDAIVYCSTVRFEPVVEKRSMALDVVSIIGLSLRRS